MGLWEDIIGFFRSPEVKEQVGNIGGGPPAPGQTTPPPTSPSDTELREKGSASVFDILSQLQREIEKNPQLAPQITRGLMIAGATIASALSFIPFTNNFGGALSSVFIGSIFRPFESKSVSGPVEDWLDDYFPTKELSPFLLIRAVESGSINEKLLVEELVDAGVKDRGINVALQFARAKRFEVETADDVRLIERYQQTIITLEIQTRQDELRSVLNDLLEERRALAAELRRLERSVI